MKLSVFQGFITGTSSRLLTGPTKYPHSPTHQLSLTLDMTNIGLVVLGVICLAIATDALEQPLTAAQQTTTGSNNETEEEPHPYTISFFVFPHGAASDLLQRAMGPKKKSTKSLITNATAANGSAEETWIDKEDIDPDLLYQRGSINHPTSEMYPKCHQCTKNSTYEGCTEKKTLQVCNKGLANICYTKSVKRGEIVHYEMGCATHRQCRRARAQPCPLKVKHCFTCCQWSGCNSQSHHHKNFPFAKDIVTKLSFDSKVSAAAAWRVTAAWALLLTSLLSTIFLL